MSDDDHHKRDVRERIANLIRANEAVHHKQITDAELKNLKSAANRLEQMLKSAADADVEILKGAAAKLDQLLADIRAGKDPGTAVKRRPEPED